MILSKHVLSVDSCENALPSALEFFTRSHFRARFSRARFLTRSRALGRKNISKSVCRSVLHCDIIFQSLRGTFSYLHFLIW